MPTLPISPVPNVVDKNGYSYPKDQLDKAITKWFETGKAIITLGSTEPLHQNLADVCAFPISIDLDNYKMEISISNTPQGNLLKSLINKPLKVSCSYIGVKSSDNNEYEISHMISASIKPA